MNKQLTVMRGLNALFYAQSSVLLPYLPLYFATKGFTTVEIGLLMMAGPFVAVFAQPVWGYISDRYRTVKNVIALLWALALLCSIGMFTVSGFPLTLTFVTLLYFFLMPSAPLLDSLSIRSAEEAGVSYGSVRLWGSVGFSVTAVVSGGILVLIGGVNNLQWIYWGIWLLPLLLLFFLQDVRTNTPPVSLSSLSVVVRNRQFLWFLLLVFVMMLPHRMNDGFLGLYMTELGAGEQLVGLAWALAAFAEVPTFALLHRYLHRVHELALLGIVGLLYIIRWIVYALVTDPVLLFVLQASHAITFAVFWVTAVTYAVRSVPPELRSTGQSLLAAVFVGMAGIAGGVFGGWLEEWGGFSSAYGIGAVLAGAAGIAFLATHAAARRKTSGGAGAG
ncbi:MFS transporter [Paenibacillus alkalitolerans]|uniref:MFS transporter n=1 Tax=Paenibacillus alkalitolerans TaxID=2799335 RepID=UPI0018F52F2A|nr:MFS transporter [Paenibacillus alkalitolerans]